MYAQNPQDFVATWERFAKCYFWSPPANASGMRHYEKINSASLAARLNGHIFSGVVDITCSCRNIYARRELYRDGQRVRITALKKALGL